MLREYLIYAHYGERDPEAKPAVVSSASDNDFYEQDLLPVIRKNPDMSFTIIGEGGDGGFSTVSYGPKGVRAHV